MSLRDWQPTALARAFSHAHGHDATLGMLVSESARTAESLKGPVVRAVHSSVDALLDPDTLSDALGHAVSRVQRTPLPQAHSSTEATFQRVLVEGARTTQLIVKIIDRSRDWVAITTGDAVDREVAVWESGTLDRLPLQAGHAVISAARHPGGSAILMRDLAGGFIGDDDPAFPEYDAAIVRSLAAVHAGFWRAPALKALTPTLCTLEAFTSHLAPTHVPTLEAAVPGHFIIDIISEGWTTLPDLIDAGMAAQMRALAIDPSPIARALSAFPTTLLHADVRPENLAFDGDGIAFVDWARPCVGPPALDLAYYLLMSHGPRPPVDETVAEYRHHLDTALGKGTIAAVSDEELDVCTAAVFTTMAPVKVAHERAPGTRHRRDQDHIQWWAQRAANGLRRIERA